MSIQNDPWFACLPPCEAHLPCGTGRHAVRWEAGTLTLPSHPDTEAELVLAALGGEKARCVAVAQAWARHTRDLTVLTVGPRSPADRIDVSWDDVDASASSGRVGGRARLAWPAARLASAPSPAIQAQIAVRRREAEQRHRQAAERRSDLYSWLALGYGFQVRLIGQVADAYADQADGGDAAVASPLISAITGRLGLVAEEWLGIDPEQVVVSLHRGPGWGSAELTGHGEKRRLLVSLPAGWLARVWAPGLALTGRHLVVAVPRGGWPAARVLALRAPGAEPVLLDVHGSGGLPGAGGGVPRETGGMPGAGDAPHWEI